MYIHIYIYVFVYMYIHIYTYTYMQVSMHIYSFTLVFTYILNAHINTFLYISYMHYILYAQMYYGVALASRLLKIIGLFCKRAL